MGRAFEAGRLPRTHDTQLMQVFDQGIMEFLMYFFSGFGLGHADVLGKVTFEVRARFSPVVVIEATRAIGPASAFAVAKRCEAIANRFGNSHLMVSTIFEEPHK